MTKIVINKDYGGFGLSDEAFELFLKKKGIKFYKKKGKLFGSSYYTVPPEEYDRVSAEGYKRDGDYRDINSRNWYLSSSDIERTDPILIEVVQKLGKKANGNCAKLVVIEIPDGVEYEIEDYDGLESIHEKHRVWR